MKRIVALVLAGLMLFALVSCAGGSLKGKWAFGGVSYEFKDDNALTVNANGMVFNGSYETEGNKLIVTVNGLTGETTKELTYTLKGDTLILNGDVTLLGAGSQELEFTRAK